ncbi:hypothetical protein J6590_038663 [Homalodisca vitripennis]|nr:hypothetical protein J6590_038663 [Homalodisca vitripennis]
MEILHIPELLVVSGSKISTYLTKPCLSHVYILGLVLLVVSRFKVPHLRFQIQGTVSTARICSYPLYTYLEYTTACSSQIQNKYLPYVDVPVPYFANSGYSTACSFQIQGTEPTARSCAYPTLCKSAALAHYLTKPCPTTPLQNPSRAAPRSPANNYNYAARITADRSFLRRSCMPRGPTRPYTACTAFHYSPSLIYVRQHRFICPVLVFEYFNLTGTSPIS